MKKIMANPSTFLFKMTELPLVWMLQDNADDFPSLNVQAKESSKDEECAAIARLRGVEAGSPIALQLKAIDQEYHHLVESGQSGKADHVMQLYAWKSKQASQVCGLVGKAWGAPSRCSERSLM